jgi:hypothetical protein
MSVKLSVLSTPSNREPFAKEHKRYKILLRLQADEEVQTLLAAVRLNHFVTSLEHESATGIAVQIQIHTVTYMQVYIYNVFLYVAIS